MMFTGKEMPDYRDRVIKALREARSTHPCSCGEKNWTSCFHVGAVPHWERRADAVLAVRDEEMEELRARIAWLESRMGKGA